jgi:hypothetical protein
MNNYSRIAQKIKEIACVESQGLLSGQVKSVNGQECDVLIGDLLLSEVKICAIADKDDMNLQIVPQIGSQVLIADMSKGEYRDLVVVKCSKIDKIVINGGDLGGLVKIQELTNKLNELVTWCKNHTHSNATFSGTIAGGAATGKLTVPSPLDVPNTLNRDDYEDKKILH